MDLVLIKPGLKALVAALTGVPAFYRDEPRPFQPDVIAFVNTKSLVRKGHDERDVRDSETPTPGEELTETIQAVRQFTLEIRLESLTHLDSSNAWTYINRVKTRLSRTSTSDALALMGLGYVRTLNANYVEVTIDQRIRSVAVVDLLLSSEFGEEGDKFTYVETFEVTGTLEP